VSEYINHPDHYNKGDIEVIDVIEDWNLGFHLGNAIKYIARSKHKGKEKEDLEKAMWYIQRYIDNKEEVKKDIVESRSYVFPLGCGGEEWQEPIIKYTEGEKLNI
jgi:hypothetical protein